MTIAANITDCERTSAYATHLEVTLIHRPLSRVFFKAHSIETPWGSFLDDHGSETLDEYLRRAHYATVDARQAVVKPFDDRITFEGDGSIRLLEEISHGHYVIVCLVEKPKTARLAEYAPRQIVTVQGRQVEALVLLPPDERERLP